MRITEQIEIDAPPTDVWAVVSDLTTHTTWRPALVEFRQVSEGPLVVGSRIREVLRWRGRDVELDDVVTAIEPERLFALRGAWSGAEFELELRLEPTASGTRVTMDWPLRPKSLLLRLAAPFLGGTMRRSTVEELEHLKAYVEGRGSSR
ncbi:MAG: SRPBCC family protein [Thermoleophilia bacterium]|nr:SRPBCC family protein [Thermoleophilia bacterium]MDH4346328.1 SRPBCC family protein [Thermoleophilia bacterium]